MQSIEKQSLDIGFMPLADCAPLVVAEHLGYFKEAGLEVRLHRQNSWATLRDKLHAGMLDAAQMLAPMPFASHLGLGVAAEPMSVPLALSFGGNGITLSRSLFNELLRLHNVSAGQLLQSPLSAALLQELVKSKKQAGSPLRFASVFPYSCHHYQLSAWLMAGGVAISDVEIVIIPPAGMVSALADGQIDGFCVGSPWNASAVRVGVGVTVLACQELWPNTLEKVLGMTREWQKTYPNTCAALVSAIQKACNWLDSLPNRFEASRWLCQSDFLNTELDVVAPALLGSCLTCDGMSPRLVSDHTLFSLPGSGNVPTQMQGIWLLQQMKANKQIAPDTDPERLVTELFH